MVEYRTTFGGLRPSCSEYHAAGRVRGSELDKLRAEIAELRAENERLRSKVGG